MSPPHPLTRETARPPRTWGPPRAPGRGHRGLGWGPRGVEVVPSPPAPGREHTLGLFLDRRLPPPPPCGPRKMPLRGHSLAAGTLCAVAACAGLRAGRSRAIFTGWLGCRGSRLLHRLLYTSVACHLPGPGKAGPRSSWGLRQLLRLVPPALGTTLLLAAAVPSSLLSYIFIM